MYRGAVQRELDHGQIAEIRTAQHTQGRDPPIVQKSSIFSLTPSEASDDDPLPNNLFALEDRVCPLLFLTQFHQPLSLYLQVRDVDFQRLYGPPLDLQLFQEHGPRRLVLRK